MPESLNFVEEFVVARDGEMYIENLPTIGQGHRASQKPGTKM